MRGSQHGQLQRLVALLLAAGQVDVERPVEEALVEADPLGLGRQPCGERRRCGRRGRERLGAARRRGATPGTSVGYCMARNRPAAARSHGVEGEHVDAVEGDRAAEHLVAGPAHHDAPTASTCRRRSGPSRRGPRRDATRRGRCPWRISLPPTAARRPRISSVAHDGHHDHDDVVAVDARRRRPAPAGWPAASGARRRRARTCSRASSTRSRASSQSTSPSDSETFGVAAGVADGVDVVAAAHEGDLPPVDLDPPGRARRERRRAAQTRLGTVMRPSRSSLAATWRHAARARRRGAGSRSSTSSKKPEHDEPLGHRRAARPGSRGRSAAPRRSGPTVEAWLQRTSLFSISRLGTLSAHAPSDSFRLRLVWKALVPRASFRTRMRPVYTLRAWPCDGALEQQVRAWSSGAAWSCRVRKSCIWSPSPK